MQTKNSSVVNASEISNLLNVSEMKETNCTLNIDLNSYEVVAEERLSNQPALERFFGLATNGYYLVMQPKTSRRGEAYLWIKATKQGEDREEFALYVNDEILNVAVAALIGKTIDISGIDANNLANFNERVQNLELALFTTEKAQGRTMKKTYSPTGQTISSYYKNGVITYKPYLNPEFKAYINA